MNIVPFQKLYNSEFFISNLFVEGQNWYKRSNYYSCIGKPKPSHTFLWFKNCRAIITDKNGNVITAEKNQITYMAKGLEYIVEFFDTAPDQIDSIVIHFQMTDLKNQEIAPILIPFICIKNVDIPLAISIENSMNEFNKNVVCLPEIAAVIYQMFSFICQNQRNKLVKNEFRYIQKGIELIENNTEKSLNEIAKICGVSEGYFRKLFKEYSGENPIDFRQKHRIEKSKQLLLLGIYSMGEIAEELHFSDIYHFSKTFKKIVGVSPRTFIAQHQAKNLQ